MSASQPLAIPGRQRPDASDRWSDDDEDGIVMRGGGLDDDLGAQSIGKRDRVESDMIRRGLTPKSSLQAPPELRLPPSPADRSFGNMKEGRSLIHSTFVMEPTTRPVAASYSATTPLMSMSVPNRVTGFGVTSGSKQQQAQQQQQQAQQQAQQQQAQQQAQQAQEQRQKDDEAAAKRDALKVEQPLTSPKVRSGLSSGLLADPGRERSEAPASSAVPAASAAQQQSDAVAAAKLVHTNAGTSSHTLAPTPSPSILSFMENAKDLSLEKNSTLSEKSEETSGTPSSVSVLAAAAASGSQPKAKGGDSSDLIFELQ